MNKFFVILIYFLLQNALPIVNRAQAQDIRGGEIRVEHIFGFSYQANIFIYTEASLDIPRQRTLHWGDGDSTSLSIITPLLIAPNIYFYSFVANHTYSAIGSYQMFLRDSFRVPGIMNIPYSDTTYLELQYSLIIDSTGFNNSPMFLNSQVDIQNNSGVITHQAYASDPDGDSLHYSLAAPLNIPGYNIPPASNSIQINPVTGEFTWDSPVAVGSYTIAIFVDEYRNGNFIGKTVRDMLIDINSIDAVSEDLDPDNPMAVYPNPATDKLYIVSNTEGDIEIFDMVGDRVYTSRTTSTKTEINVSDLCNGIYFVTISDTKGNKLTTKFVKI